MPQAGARYPGMRRAPVWPQPHLAAGAKAQKDVGSIQNDFSFSVFSLPHLEPLTGLKGEPSCVTSVHFLQGESN